MIVRRALASTAWLAVGASLALAAPAPPTRSGAALSIWRDGAWRAWWRAADAPARWRSADPEVAGALAWRRLADGIEWAMARISCSAPAGRTRLVVARIDPSRVRLSLAMELSAHDGCPAWTIDRAPADALLAVNAGQFVRTMPWGCVVMDGHERLRPGVGPLSRAMAVDTAGGVRWIAGDSLATPPAEVVTAFQSYPTLLASDGQVPPALRAAGGGVNLAHRDSRLAIG